MQNSDHSSKFDDATIHELIDWNLEIGRSATRASEIVQRLRNFTSGSVTDREFTDISQLILESVDLLMFDSRQHDIELIFDWDLTQEFPPVFCDPIQIQQVLINLLHNAYEAVFPLTGLRTVRINLLSVEDQIEVEIADNGPGIAPELRSSLFEAFYSTKENGMGMGLAISRTIVEAHHGEILISDNEAGGASFIIRLPAAVRPETDLADPHFQPDRKGIRK